jgi:hypothetical protein
MIPANSMIRTLFDRLILFQFAMDFFMDGLQ